LPKDLPEFLEADIADLDIGDSLHISEINLPKGVESVALIHGEDHDLPVASILHRGGSSDEEETTDEAATDEAAATEDAPESNEE